MDRENQTLWCINCGNDVNKPGSQKCSQCGAFLSDYNVPEIIDKEAEATFHLSQSLKNGANWFYWISGLSLLNTIIPALGGNWRFIIGLAMTEYIDAYGRIFSNGITDLIYYCAIILNLLITGFFAWIGYSANKAEDWAFGTGMIVYALDGLLLIFASDVIGVGFHTFALYFIFKGYMANKTIQQINSDREVGLVSDDKMFDSIQE